MSGITQKFFEKLSRRLSSRRPLGCTESAVAAVPSLEKAAACGVRAAFFVVRPDRGQLAKIGDLIDTGRVRSTIGAVLPLSQGSRAYESGWGAPAGGKTILKAMDE
jgi:NADPH:quinone reductase-like Zn-dependent oxidoreductase